MDITEKQLDYLSKRYYIKRKTIKRYLDGFVEPFNINDRYNYFYQINKVKDLNIKQFMFFIKNLKTRRVEDLIIYGKKFIDECPELFEKEKFTVLDFKKKFAMICDEDFSNYVSYEMVDICLDLIYREDYEMIEIDLNLINDVFENYEDYIKNSYHNIESFFNTYQLLLCRDIIYFTLNIDNPNDIKPLVLTNIEHLKKVNFVLEKLKEK